MRCAAEHRIIAAREYRLPKPFRALAVRSDEARHIGAARAPYGCVHRVQTPFLDAGALACLAAEARARVRVEAYSDIDHAATTLKDLTATTVPDIDLARGIAGALRATGVLGPAPAPYLDSISGRVDHLGCCGTGFHNDVAHHWSACLFWVLALELAEVEFVLPHAGLRLPLAPGDLLVFDPAMAHGLCHRDDQGQALASSFEAEALRLQLFLTGELALTDAQWATLGAPWLPVEEHEGRGALDLRVAEFDDRSGAVQRPSALRGCMKRSSDPSDGLSD
jgi:hypothetical protein